MEKMVHKLSRLKHVRDDEYRPTLTCAVLKFVDVGKVAAKPMEDFQRLEEHSIGRLSGLFLMPFELRQPDYFNTVLVYSVPSNPLPLLVRLARPLRHRPPERQRVLTDCFWP